MAYFAGLAYGDGYPEYGEVRVVTSSELFKKKVLGVVEHIAAKNQCTCRVYTRPGNISDNPQITIALNSTAVRRILFNDDKTPRYDTILAIATDVELAPYFQAGLTDAEGTLVLPEPIEYPHGRIFAIGNNDKRLLGICRLSMVRILKLEPTSVRIRLYSKRGRRHTVRGVLIVTRRNNFILEVLSGAKLKWLNQVGQLLRHPDKASKAAILLATYSTKEDVQEGSIPH